MGTSFRLSVFLSTASMLMQACLQAAAPISMPTRNGDNTGADDVRVEWNLEDPDLFASGLGEAVNSSFLEENGTSYCFENFDYGVSCRRSTRFAVTSVIGEVPVAIRGFQLNFSKTSFDTQVDSQGDTQYIDYLDVVISGAWVQTSELQFDISEGSMRLLNPVTTTVHAGACDISNVNTQANGFTVGYLDSDRILTGLYFSDEYDLTGGSVHVDGHIRAARISYSGIVAAPEPEGENSTCGAFCWNFLPTDGNPVTNDIGPASFNDVENAIGSKGSKFFGVTASTPSVTNWNKRVITGFCINGYKQVSPGVQRPLLHHVKVRTHAPQLVRE